VVVVSAGRGLAGDVRRVNRSQWHPVVSLVRRQW
jgi:hypothetical protein